MSKPRPNSVRLALACICVSFGLASIQMMVRVSWSDPLTYLAGSWTLTAAWLLVFLVSRGADWARWLFVTLVASATVMLVADLNDVVIHQGTDPFVTALYRPLIVTVSFSVGWLLAFLVFRGTNWARWLFVSLIVGSTVMLVIDLNDVGTRQGANPILLTLHRVLMGTASLLLFTRSANDWFRLPGMAKLGRMNPPVPPPLPRT